MWKLDKKSKEETLEELIAEIIDISEHSWKAQLSYSLTHKINAFSHALGAWNGSITTQQNLTTDHATLAI